MVLGGSSSAPNLQDYARAHRKKLTSSGFLDEATRGSAVKRFSISFARHPTNGFELYSMVPSICPLETLHNSLSLKQVDDFLASIAKSHDSILNISASSPAVKKAPLNTYTPAKILPCPFTQGKKTTEKAAGVSGASPSKSPQCDPEDPSPNSKAGRKSLQATTGSKPVRQPSHTTENEKPSRPQHTSSGKEKPLVSNPGSGGDDGVGQTSQHDTESRQVPQETLASEVPAQPLTQAPPSGLMPPQHPTRDTVTCTTCPSLSAQDGSSSKVLLTQSMQRDEVLPQASCSSRSGGDEGKARSGVTMKDTLVEGASSLTTGKERDTKHNSK